MFHILSCLFITFQGRFPCPDAPAARGGSHAHPSRRPRHRPADIAAKWLKATGHDDLEQAWWNTQMGLPHRPRSGKEVRLERLASRGEVWSAEVPDGVGVLTVGADVQDDRVELEVVGWGWDEESWSIDDHVIEGDPDSSLVWDEVDKHLRRIWYRADGRGFEIMAACIDSGGHHTQKVYEFAKARLGRRVWAVKGESARGGQRSPVWPTKKPTRRTKSSPRRAWSTALRWSPATAGCSLRAWSLWPSSSARAGPHFVEHVLVLALNVYVRVRSRFPGFAPPSTHSITGSTASSGWARSSRSSACRCRWWRAATWPMT